MYLLICLPGISFELIVYTFVKVIASYVLAKKGIDELLVIKINDVEFHDSRDTRQNFFPDSVAFMSFREQLPD